MKFGVKFWSTNKELLKLAKAAYDEGKFDHLELSAIKGTFNEELLSCLKGIPVVIHCDNTNVDFSDPSLLEENKAALQEAIKFADFLDRIDHSKIKKYRFCFSFEPVF